ncbi:hypothetical protein BGY98DRAFT_1190925 [Russula aff. rugulosa BPL654]|nr:hypothetical protein BGY98DRAFT_1190925 [Russula aff. rugulosa BPL654]
MTSATDLESGQGGAQDAPHTAETLDETPPSSIPSGEFRPFTSISGGSNIDHSQRNVSDQSIQIQTGQDLSQAEAEIYPASEQNPEEPRMIGDFDGSSNALWTLFRDEAKSHDDARIVTLKDDMESSLIFAGLFSAALTAFVVDSKQNLTPSPADETVYYLRQHSTILSQISVQLSSIAPQISIPSTPPPPFPCTIRLHLTLLAALLAILVQQWVRDYMHVFQRYGDPLKSSRLRQYLFEGCEGWYMPMVAEAVPGFLHISLFLFFGGLGDSLLSINTKVGLSTIVPIGVSGLLYVFTIFAPIIYPQSPYQNSFSGIFWYLFQKSRGRRFNDRGSDGEVKPVSANMAQGQMQLAMEETVARKDRDVRAIRWLIDNLTEDAEMEKFLPAIPGSFNTDWGTEVWKMVGEHHKNEDQSQDELLAIPHGDATAHQPSSSSRIRGSPVPHPLNLHPHSTTAHIRRENVVHELGTRVSRSVEICKNRKLFSSKDLWQKRTRACIEATASLVCLASANVAWFGGISELLGEIGSFEKIRELSLAGTDELRPECAVRARRAMEFAEADETGNMEAAQKMDETLEKARDCLFDYTTPNWEPIPFSRFVELSRDPRKLQFTCPRQTLKSMCSPSLTLRNILEGQGDADAYKELLKNLNIYASSHEQIYEMQRQLWRLQDFCDGGGLGFTVELFFIVFWQFLSTSSSKESNSALYTGTFRAITSDWSKYKHSLGTQNSFSISLCHANGSLMTGILFILSTSSCCY